jgi:hypothetical protein
MPAALVLWQEAEMEVLRGEYGGNPKQRDTLSSLAVAVMGGVRLLPRL